jgi:hypothetical protein
VGHVGDDVRRDGDLTAGTIYLEDQVTIDKVLSKELVELSAGYTTTLVHEPGVTADGIQYDARQTEIRGNHVAILPVGRGRAGREVRLRLDAADNEIQMTTEDRMDPKELKAALADIREDVATAVKAALAERDQLQGRVDALETQNAELQAQVAEVTADDHVQARVNARLALLEQARKIKPEIKADGLSDREVMLEALGDKVDPDATDDYLRGALTAHVDSIVERKADQAERLIIPRPGGPTEPVKHWLDEAEEQFCAAMAGEVKS